MSIMKNATEGIYPYQQVLYEKIATGGFKRSEMFIISSGRRLGKSYLNSLYGSIGGYGGTNLCKEILLPMYAQPKYKFSRAKWYVADFDINDCTDVVHWCREQFGPHPRYPDAWTRWEHRYENKIRFRDEKDYAWFVLRWS